MTNWSIEIVCHRGANQYAPENTYASAQICIDWGMDYLEIDIITSKDGVLHVFHGPELAKTTNGSGYIFEHTAAKLAQLDAGGWFDPKFAGEPIPQLAPFLRWVKGKIKLFLAQGPKFNRFHAFRFGIAASCIDQRIDLRKYELIGRKELPGVRRLGRHLRICQKTVLKWISEGESRVPRSQKRRSA